ncbi:unnamed protein product, partial [Cyprideis torosa]
MEVILKQDVENLGFVFDVVNVKPGYGRNYLIPKGLAELATPSAKKQLNETLEARAAEEKANIDAANELIEKIKAVELKISAKVGEGDKLFGSVNNGDIAEALKAKGVQIEKKHIKISGT